MTFGTSFSENSISTTSDCSGEIKRQYGGLDGDTLPSLEGPLQTFNNKILVYRHNLYDLILIL